MPLVQAELWLCAGLTESSLANLGAALELLQGRQPPTIPPLAAPLPPPSPNITTRKPSPLRAPAAGVFAASSTVPESFPQRHRIRVSNLPPGMRLSGLQAIYSLCDGYVEAELAVGGGSGWITFATESGARWAAESKRGVVGASQACKLNPKIVPDSSATVSAHRLGAMLEADLPSPAARRRSISPPRCPRAMLNDPSCDGNTATHPNVSPSCPSEAFKTRHRYIGNLAPQVGELALTALLESVVEGPVGSIKMGTGSQARYAFVELAVPEDVGRAIDALHGEKLGGQPLVVQKPRTDRAIEEVAKQWPHRIFIAGLPLTTTVRKVEQLVALSDPSARDVVCWVIGTVTFAYINVESAKALARVIAELDGKMVEGKRISAKRASAPGQARGPATRLSPAAHHRARGGSTEDEGQCGGSQSPRRSRSSRSGSPTRRSSSAALAPPGVAAQVCFGSSSYVARCLISSSRVVTDPRAGPQTQRLKLPL